MTDDDEVKFYPLASDETKKEVFRIAHKWAKGTGRLFNTGTSTGFAVGAVAEFLANQRGVTVYRNRTGEEEAARWLADELNT